MNLAFSVWKGAVHNIPIRVFIAAENRLLREALVRLFQSQKDVKVVGQAGHCSEAAPQLLNVRPDVFLLNPASHLLSDLIDLQETHRGLPQLKIVLFGMVFLEAVRQRADGRVRARLGRCGPHRGTRWGRVSTSVMLAGI